MSFSIGSIQGRLLPPVDGRIQAFPRGRWEEEFHLLHQIGYSSMELTIETASWAEHPINSARGRERLQSLSREYGIALEGICCDVFMEHPLVGAGEPIQYHHADAMLRELLQNSAELGLPFIELPFVGKNTLASDSAMSRLHQVLDWALPFAEERKLHILLETDLHAAVIVDLLKHFQHPCLGLNYDTGNSTWFGFDPEEELRSYHQYIRNIHIKDCTRKDYSVPLGLGETLFDTIFSLLQQFDYKGNFILQAARQEDDIQAAREYFAFTSTLVEKFFHLKSVK